MNGVDACFVDSNLLLYAIAPLEVEKRAVAGQWVAALWSAGTGRLSWQVLNEFYWNATRKLRVPVAVARSRVEDLSRWKPVDTSIGLIQLAWEWSDKAQLAYWDALIVASALRSGARYLLSEDFAHGRRFDDLCVLNPFEATPPLLSK
jgi:predicted nucleic acid-binding protein